MFLVERFSKKNFWRIQKFQVSKILIRKECAFRAQYRKQAEQVFWYEKLGRFVKKENTFFIISWRNLTETVFQLDLLFAQ